VDSETDGAIELYNSDGSTAEISATGLRCAAAFLIRHGYATGVVRVLTGAGLKTLRVLQRSEFGLRVRDEHGPSGDLRRALRPAAGRGRATSRCCGWATRSVPCRSRTSSSTGGAWGAEIERHKHFPNRTNVSFLKVVE